MRRTACVLTLLAGAAFAEGIAWSRDLAAAREQAARDGRPVLLYFTFDT